MYADGCGVPQDDVRTFAWLNLAVAQDGLGTQAIGLLRDRMTAAQVAAAQTLSADLFRRINGE